MALSTVLAVLVNLGPIVLLLVIAWRIMRSQERMANTLERLERRLDKDAEFTER